MTKTERRTLPVADLRAEEAADQPAKIVGYAALFNSMSRQLGGAYGFREQIAPGAFAEALQASDVRALFNHDDNLVLGRQKSGTLTLTEDERGLRVEITPPDAQWARDLLVSMRRGDVDQMSFGFIVAEGGDHWENTDEGVVRTLLKIGELFDVSVVTQPAYEDTTVAVRSLEHWSAARQASGVPNALNRTRLASELVK